MAEPIGTGGDWERLSTRLYRAGYAGQEEIQVPVTNIGFFKENSDRVTELAESLLNEPGAAEMDFDIDLNFVHETQVNKIRPMAESSGEGLALSGGMDSVAALLKMEDPTCTFVDYGQDHVDRELAMAQTVAMGQPLYHRKLSPALASHEDAWDHDGFKVPARNFVFLTALLPTVKKVDYPIELAIGAYKGEMSPKNRDKNEEFFETVSELFSDYAGVEVNVGSPVGDMQKPEILSFIDENSSMNLWQLPFCDNGNRCADCKSCFNYAACMEYAGLVVTDRQWDEVDGDWKKDHASYESWVQANRNSSVAKYYLNHIEQYDQYRRDVITEFVSES